MREQGKRIDASELYYLGKKAGEAKTAYDEGDDSRENQEILDEYSEKEREFLAWYQSVMSNSDSSLTDYYKSVRNARQAFKQKIPEDILSQASNAEQTTGNSANSSGDDTATRLLHPAFTITAKKSIESFSALPFRFDIAANDQFGLQQKRVIDNKLKEIYTMQNVTNEMFYAYYLNIINGLSITQTKTFKKKRTVLSREIDPETGMFAMKPVNSERVISIMAYDPLNTVPDLGAKASNMTETSEYVIITDKYITKDDAQTYYHYEGQRTFDTHKQNLAVDNGVSYDKFVPVREYYDRSGFFIKIVGDSKIISIEQVSNGTVGKIPINIAPIWADPDSPTGATTLWDYVKNMVILASRGLNLICDNVALNNNSPFFTFTGSGLEDNALLDEFNPREIVPVNPIGTNPNINNQLWKPTFPEVTQGTQAMFENGQQLSFMLAGSSPINFGYQDKQIRVSGAADMINSATVRPDGS